VDDTFFSALGAAVAIHRFNDRDAPVLPTTLLDRPSQRRAPRRAAWGRERARTTAPEPRLIIAIDMEGLASVTAA
jgi:hypothetical protein